MTRQIGDLDHIYVVPLDGMSLADAFAFTDSEHGIWRLAYGEGDMPLVSLDDLPTLEVIEDIPGGCLVRIGALANDVPTLAAFLAKRDGPATLQALEFACHQTELFVETLGGLAASRSRNRWRPIDDRGRATWGAHLVNWNSQKLRADAAFERARQSCRSAAEVVLAALKAA